MTTMLTPERWHPASPAMSYASNQPAIQSKARLPDLNDVRGLITRTLSQTRALGRDDLTQTRAAAQAVVAVRTDLTLAQAFDGVARLQAAGAV